MNRIQALRQQIKDYDPVERGFIRLGLTTIFMVMIIASLVIALLAQTAANTASRNANKASKDALAVVTCVNRILASRQSPGATDAVAHIDFAKALNAIVNTAAPTPQQIAAFRAAANSYVGILTTNNDYRTAHPLGEC